MTSGAAKWYKNISKEGVASPTIKMKKLVATETFKNCSREILSRITQLITGNKNFGKYLQKRTDPKNDYNCKYKEFKIL